MAIKKNQLITHYTDSEVGNSVETTQLFERDKNLYNPEDDYTIIVTMDEYGINYEVYKILK